MCSISFFVLSVMGYNRATWISLKIEMGKNQDSGKKAFNGLTDIVCQMVIAVQNVSVHLEVGPHTDV